MTFVGDNVILISSTKTDMQQVPLIFTIFNPSPTTVPPEDLEPTAKTDLVLTNILAAYFGFISLNQHNIFVTPFMK